MSFIRYFFFDLLSIVFIFIGCIAVTLALTDNSAILFVVVFSLIGGFSSGLTATRIIREYDEYRAIRDFCKIEENNL